MRGLLLASLLGCGTASPTPASVPNQAAPAPLTPAPAAIACPDDATVRGALIRDAYPRIEKIHRCVPGKFPQPALAVVGSSGISGLGGPSVLALVSEDARNVIASLPSDCPSFDDRGDEQCTVEVVSVLDLDGDGSDELLVETHNDPRYYSRTLWIYSVAGTTLRSVGTFELASSFMPYDACRYRYSIGDPDMRGRRSLTFSPLSNSRCKTCTVDLSNSNVEAHEACPRTRRTD
ncbi:MAG: hypothetical protein HOV81_28430 [Kofleriaceae bacterium]|nr:hypothetical protein [Kofleriaceae bacterium]